MTGERLVWRFNRDVYGPVARRALNHPSRLPNVTGDGDDADSNLWVTHVDWQLALAAVHELARSHSLDFKPINPSDHGRRAE